MFIPFVFYVSPEYQAMMLLFVPDYVTRVMVHVVMIGLLIARRRWWVYVGSVLSFGWNLEPLLKLIALSELLNF